MEKNASSATFRQLESVLLQEIDDISTQIRELMHQKQSVERMLLKARQQSELVKHSDVTRKNSINRILVEGSIAQTLGRKKSPVRARDLYQNARLMVPTLRENTFRSHLFRMKARGIITSRSPGMWELVNDGTREEQA
ncbi:MAG: hypothetical protein AB7S93_18305 [Xanthobacteraceae bacterium]